MNALSNLTIKKESPTNDFTDMNIIPNLKDILSDQTPFLRKNITNGAYKSVDHYLDVQFRLLREDYLNPLREGVYKFREIINKQSHKQPTMPPETRNKLETKLYNN